MSTRNETNPWGDIFEDCPPETVYGLYLNAAIDAVGAKHGRMISNLSEEVAQLVFDVIQVSAYAVFEAASLPDDWRAMLDARANAQLLAPCDHATLKAHPPSWEVAVIETPIDLYREMSWTFQARECPQLLCSCVGLTGEQKDQVIAIIDAMLEFALLAAGVDREWDELYERTVKKMESRNVEE